MTKKELNERMKSQIGKRVMIQDKEHPWFEEIGRIKEFDYFVGKPAAVIDLDNGINCAVYSGHHLKFL